MTERVKEYMRSLKCVCRERYHWVFFNPQTGKYELWLRDVEQCDVYDSKEEAIEDMIYSERHFWDDYD